MSLSGNTSEFSIKSFLPNLYKKYPSTEEVIKLFHTLNMVPTTFCLINLLSFWRIKKKSQCQFFKVLTEQLQGRMAGQQQHVYYHHHVSQSVVMPVQHFLYWSVYRRHYDLVSKFNTGFKSVKQHLSKLEFYGDLVYKFRKQMMVGIFFLIY